MQNKANLRKGQTSVSFFFRRAYEKNDAWAVQKNKAKQSQFYIFTADNAEYAEMKNICVSDCPIEKYGLYPMSPCSLRTRRLMTNKANFERQSQRNPARRSAFSGSEGRSGKPAAKWVIASKVTLENKANSWYTLILAYTDKSIANKKSGSGGRRP